MKSHSHMRNSAGAILGFIAGTIIIIFIIGVFLYFAGCMVGGNHQLNKASDAGILNAARQALVQPAIGLNDPTLVGATTLPYKDFAAKKDDGTYFIADQEIGSYPAIDLLTYNRCAAQAVMVSTQATAINTPLARQHAQQVCLAVWYLGQALQKKFNDGSLDNFYDNEAAANTLSVLGIGNKTVVTREASLAPAYIGVGRPSNIYFYPDVINPFAPGTVMATNGISQSISIGDVVPDAAKVKAGDAYMPAGEKIYYASGYTPITVMPGQKEASIVGFVPVGPQHFAHAIDQERTNAGVNPPPVLIYAPPNAFKAKAKAKVSFNSKSETNNSNTYVNAVSCAMVGCGGQDYPATIPGGYLEIANLPDMVQAGHLPLGPVPAPNEGNAYDASNFVMNKEGLGLGGSGDPTIYFATPIPKKPDGSVDIDNTVFGFDANGKAAMKFWIAFNTSRLAAGDKNYNADVVTIDGVAQHRNPDLDGYASPNNTAKKLNNGKNPTGNTLREGAGLGGKAHLLNMVRITGYVILHSLVFDGVTPVTGTNGDVSADVIGEVMFKAAGPNAGDVPPMKFELHVPPERACWTWVEYLKDRILYGFGSHFDRGYYDVPALSLDTLRTGMKTCKWYNKKGKQIHYAAPNNFLLQTTGRSKGLEIPTSPQFMTIGNAIELLNQIDTDISHSGYQSGGNPGSSFYNGTGDQINLDNFYGSIMNQLRLINPKWSETDLFAALKSTPLPPGATMYLRDDGKGNLIMSNTCPQNVGAQPEGWPLADTIGRAVQFVTLPGQQPALMDYVLNTLIDGTPTAYKADANVEQQPARTVTGDTGIKLLEGAVLYKSTGYNNLVGTVHFYCQPSQAISGIHFTHFN